MPGTPANPGSGPKGVPVQKAMQAKVSQISPPRARQEPVSKQPATGGALAKNEAVTLGFGVFSHKSDKICYKWTLG